MQWKRCSKVFPPMRVMTYSGKKANFWHDHYAQRAIIEKFPARSVYKLQEIQHKYDLIKKGASVLDLGCSPGSWLLYAAELAGKTGRVTGMDIKPVTLKLPDNVNVITGDILDILTAEPLKNSLGDRFDVVLSDMAPSTTGNSATDCARSVELCRRALSLANEKLIIGGSFVCKIFQGEDFQAYLLEVRACFEQHKIFKPKSSRKTSREIYIIGMGKK
jgi:23S rRNA (uridine2552-2'-O)-methyltransferase